MERARITSDEAIAAVLYDPDDDYCDENILSSEDEEEQDIIGFDNDADPTYEPEMDSSSDEDDVGRTLIEDDDQSIDKRDTANIVAIKLSSEKYSTEEATSSSKGIMYRICLAGADDNVKRLFSLEFQPRPIYIKAIRQNYMDSVKQHNMDNTSPEAVIAAQTASIRHLQKYIETVKGKKAPRTVRIRIKELVEQRAKWLRRLRFQDYKLFEWLLERLDLVHKPLPASIVVERVERKKSLRRLTDIYCETLRQDRLDQYREQLELQHEEFLEKKVETLRWIQSKEKEFNLKTTVNDEDIESIVKQLEEVRLQKKAPIEE